MNPNNNNIGTHAKIMEGPHSYALTLLYAMNRLGKHVYGGTVPSAVVAKRRAANKRAKAQRKINR